LSVTVAAGESISVRGVGWWDHYPASEATALYMIASPLARAGGVRVGKGKGCLLKMQCRAEVARKIQCGVEHAHRNNNKMLAS